MLFHLRNQKCNQMTQEFHIRFSTHAYYFSDRNISYFRRYFRKWKSPLTRRRVQKCGLDRRLRHTHTTLNTEQNHLAIKVSAGN